MRLWALRLAALALIGAGAWMLAGGLITPAKAALGRLLLDRAFEARVAAPAAERAQPALWRPWRWADLAPIGRVSFPRLDESRIVLDSASGEALAWGVGRVRAAAELGAPGLTALAGHRDGAFAFLGEVELGDQVELATLEGGAIRYEIIGREVVDSRFTGLPLRHHGPDDLLLTTCWPIDAVASGPERLLLRARRIGVSDGAAAE